MANTVALTWKADLAAAETLDLGQDLHGSATVTHQIPGGTGTLNGSTTPAVTKVSSDTRNLAAGTDTIDLSAAPGPTLNGSATTLNMTGLKVQAFIVFAAAANTAAIVIKDGAANGYNLFGDASGQVTLPAGSRVVYVTNEGLPDVGPTAKTIDVTSGDTDAAYSFVIVAG